MPDDFEKYRTDDRVAVDIAKTLFDRISMLAELVEMSDMSDERKASFRKDFSLGNIVDIAVHSFLEGFTEDLDSLFLDD